VTPRSVRAARSNGELIAGGARIFQRMFTRLGCHGRPPHFVVEFYAYANLVHTVRLRDDTAYVRLSDVLRGAPLPAMEAAAAILLGRLYRRQAPRDLVESYRHFLVSRGTHRRLATVRRNRGRRVQGGPKGKAHNLGPMFSRLNREYFRGRLHRPRLGWSARSWRAQLGCFDPGLDQIVVSKRLDRSEVPRHVVEYVLYHEMLHVRHPLRVAACGLQAHSAAFRAEERRYAHYKRAHSFLEKWQPE
jgi:predicted metal-dependent hydrolase